MSTAAEPEKSNQARDQRNRTILDSIFGLVLFSTITFVLAPPPAAVFQVTDLSEFYCGAALFQAGRSAEIYDVARFFPFQIETFPALGTRAVPLYVAPFGLPFLLPLLIFPATVAYLCTKVLLIACFLVGLYLLVQVFKLSSRWFMWLCAVLPFSGPVWEALRIEQVSPMLFLSMACHLYFLERKRPVLAALCLLPFLVKPHLAVTMVAFHLGGCRFRFCLAFLGFSLAFLIASYLYCGADTYKNYFALLKFSMQDLRWMNPEATPTLRGQLLRLSVLPTATVNSLTSAFFALLQLVVVGFGFKLRRKSVAQAAAMVAIPMGLVFSLHCYSYDLVLILPAVILAFHGAFLALGEKLSLGAAPSLLRRQMPLLMPVVFVLGLLVPVLSFCLPFYALIHYVFTLRDSVINYHFILLLALTIYLVVDGFRQLQGLKWLRQSPG